MDPTELESRFRFVEKNHVTALIVAEATFYFIDLEAAKSGLIAAYERVMAVLRPHATLYATESMDRAKKLSASVDALFAKWFGAKKTVRDLYALSIQSGDALEAVGPWVFEFAVAPEVLNPTPTPLEPEPGAGEAGVFHFTLPVDSLLAKDSPFRDLVVDVARLLPFVLVTRASGSSTRMDTSYLNEISKSMLGLDDSRVSIVQI